MQLGPEVNGAGVVQAKDEWAVVVSQVSKCLRPGAIAGLMFPALGIGSGNSLLPAGYNGPMASTADVASTAVTLREFLESVPPGEFLGILDLGGDITYGGGGARIANLNRPEILLYCDSDACAGNRFFRTGDSVSAQTRL